VCACSADGFKGRGAALVDLHRILEGLYMCGARLYMYAYMKVRMEGRLSFPAYEVYIFRYPSDLAYQAARLEFGTIMHGVISWFRVLY